MIPKLRLKYHSGQNNIFYQSTARKRIVAKGRRWGFTKGCAQYVIESMLDGVGPVMWGDTISANIISYVERYFFRYSLSSLPTFGRGRNRKRSSSLVTRSVISGLLTNRRTGKGSDTNSLS